MKTKSSPLARLQHHVTGAIERGEAQAIEGIPASAPLVPLSAPVGVSGVTLPVLHGHEAIEYAREHGLTLSKYNDPMEDAREDLSPDQALEIAKVDPSLIYLAPPASPVDSVGVPEENPYDLGLDLPLVWAPTDSGSLMQAQQAVIMDDNGFKLAECSTEFARAACRGLNGYASHAANLAKLKALERALEGLLSDPLLLSEVREAQIIVERESAENVEDRDAYAGPLLERVSAARAALALPSA